MDEAVAYDLGAVAVPIAGEKTERQYEVLVPQAFSYLLMKLFAFRDREAEGETEVSRHHALDLYRIIAMLTEGDYETARTLARQYGGNPYVRAARDIVSEFFERAAAFGPIRIREHVLFREGFDLLQFIAVLRELLP